MDALMLSRIQFGGTAGFHIIWPLMSIGLALFMVVMEAMWLKTKKDSYYRQLKFWTKIFILSFAIGTATGFPLEFEFGTNWARFSMAAGDFFGNILGFESTVAFALEAAFLGIFVFGWNKVNKWMHFFANLMIFVGATLSAFWIMAANSWMQIPTGVILVKGKFVVTDYFAAVFNPGTLVSFGHMWVACIEATLFMMMGMCALIMIRKTTIEPTKAFFLTTFKYCLALAVIITPLQVLLGDLSGQVIAEHQPAKLAATELHWETNPEGEGAPWAIVAWPNAENNGNAFEITIPYGLSLLTTHTPDGQVEGLNEFPVNDRPTAMNSIIVFYAFRVMVAIGMILVLLMILGMWYWKRGYLKGGPILPGITPRAGQGGDKLFWSLFIFAMPLGFIATEAGWMVREIGRQPWIVYNMLRTSQGVSPNLDPTTVAITIGIFTVMYVTFTILFVYFTWRILKAGPDLTSPVPAV